MNGIYALIPVWGERYVQRWLNLSLPSLLAPGNLPALARRYPVKTLLYTTREDMTNILAAPAVKALRDVAPLRILPIAESRADAVKMHAGSVMTGCHKAGLIQAAADDCGILPLVSDSVYSDGIFTSVADKIAAGKRAVVTQGFGVVDDQFTTCLCQYGVAPTGTLSIAPRTLVRIILETMHPSFAARFWDAPNYTSHPAIMYWRLAPQAFLMRGWHLYPLFAYPDRKALMHGSVDDDLIGVGFSNLEEQCVALDDSDDGVFVDVLDPLKRDDVQTLEVLPHRATVEFVAGWAQKWTRPLHERSLQRYKLWVHAEEIDRDRHREVEAASDQIIESILARLAVTTDARGTALLP